jgi:hypothetical protein
VVCTLVSHIDRIYCWVKGCNVQAAGRMRVMQARVIKDELAWAAVIWNVAS